MWQQCKTLNILSDVTIISEDMAVRETKAFLEDCPAALLSLPTTWSWFGSKTGARSKSAAWHLRRHSEGQIGFLEPHLMFPRQLHATIWDLQRHLLSMLAEVSLTTA
jgi:hypothetical protein